MLKEGLDRLAERIIGVAIETHKALGPGLLESVYEAAMCVELKTAGLSFDRQKLLPIVYKGHAIGEFRVDLVIENAILLELKSVERFDSIFEAQILSYLKISGLRLGFLMNFNTRLLKDGIRRFIL